MDLIGLLRPKPKSPVDRFIAHVRAECKKNDIVLFMPETETLDCDGEPSRGYFDGETLACAVGHPVKKWIDILAHEYCHLTQYVENAPVWHATSIVVDGEEIDTGDLYWNWIKGRVELSPKQVLDYIGRARDLELDNEKRTVKVIQEFDLPIDISNYIRRANAYVMFYSSMMVLRKWCIKKDLQFPSITEQPEILKLMSDKFDMDYENPPLEVLVTFAELVRRFETF